MKKVAGIVIVAIICCTLFFSLNVFAKNDFVVNIDNFKLDNNILENNTIEQFSSNYKIQTKEEMNSDLRNELVPICKYYTYLFLGGDVNNDTDDFEKRFNEILYGDLKYDYNVPKDSDGNLDTDSKEFIRLAANEINYNIVAKMLEKADICYNEISSINLCKNEAYPTGYKISDYIGIIKVKDAVMYDIFSYDKKGNMKLLDNADEILSKEDIPLVRKDLLLYVFIIEDEGVKKVSWVHIATNDSINDYVDNQKKQETASSNLEISSYINSDIYENYNWSKYNKITKEQLTSVYEKNSNNLVILRTYNDNSIITTGNGFFIKDGIIMTSWNYIKESLENGQNIVIADKLGNVYEMEGIVTANINADIAVIKLTKENNMQVNIEFNDNIELNDPVATISSKSGVNFSITAGINISEGEKDAVTIVTTDEEKGAPVYDMNGNLVSMMTSKITNASISQTVNIKYIMEIYNKLKDVDFNNIKSVNFSKLKNDYYIKETKTKKSLNLSEKQWNNIKQIGNLENTIFLDLVKSNYYKGVTSLRYYNEVKSLTNSMQLANGFMKELESTGYTKTLDSEKKVIYENEKYNIAIMEEFDYLIIIISKK